MTPASTSVAKLNFSVLVSHLMYIFFAQSARSGKIVRPRVMLKGNRIDHLLQVTLKVDKTI